MSIDDTDEGEMNDEPKATRIESASQEVSKLLRNFTPTESMHILAMANTRLIVSVDANSEKEVREIMGEMIDAVVEYWRSMWG